MALDASKAEAWALQDRQPVISSVVASARFGWHHVLPRMFQTNFTITQLFLMLLKVIAVIVIASAPIWIDHFEKNQLPLHKSLLYSGALIFAMMYLYFHQNLRNRRNENRNRRRHERLVALKHSDVVKNLRRVVKVRATPQLQGRADELIDSLVNCMDHKTRAFLYQYEESYFQTTLLVFNDSQGNQILIKSRAFPTRRVGVLVNARESAAYFVAKAKRDWKAIHDLKRDSIFSYNGLSESAEPPYRSILLIPIIMQSDNGSGTICKGVVSIDAAKPYEFWGAVGSDLTSQLLPYAQMIGLLLDENKFGMAV